MDALDITISRVWSSLAPTLRSNRAAALQRAAELRQVLGRLFEEERAVLGEVHVVPNSVRLRRAVRAPRRTAAQERPDLGRA